MIIPNRAWFSALGRAITNSVPVRARSFSVKTRSNSTGLSKRASRANRAEGGRSSATEAGFSGLEPIKFDSL